jgi:hypothetical protein
MSVQASRAAATKTLHDINTPLSAALLTNLRLRSEVEAFAGVGTQWR